MWRKLSENILTVIVTVVLVVGAAALLFNHALQHQQATLLALQEQNDALRSQSDDNRHELQATVQILRDAVRHNNNALFSSDEEIARLNGDRMNALADAIAQRVAPKMPVAKSSEELSQQENEQIDRISSATAQKLAPAIADLAAQQKAGSASGRQVAAARVEVEHIRQNLAATQQAADDALKLTQQLSAMYLQTYQEHGALVRILTLPGDLIQDAASGSIVTAQRARTREQRELDAKIKEIEQRLSQIRVQAGTPLASAN
jgi:hypothetical protein